MGKEKKKKIVFLVLLIIIIVGLVFIIYNSVKPDAVEMIEMSLTVGNYTGFDVNKTALTFGTAMPSASVQRTINIQNIGGEVHNIKIEKIGELADWTTLSESEFVLKGTESKKIDVTVNVPGDAEYRKYVGSVKVVFRKLIFFPFSFAFFE